jgi:hypothetical protein
MHPEFVEGLAHEHRAELLRAHQFRHRKYADNAAYAAAAAPIGRARRSLGRTFVALGARLLGDEPAAVELFTTRR